MSPMIHAIARPDQKPLISAYIFISIEPNSSLFNTLEPNVFVSKYSNHYAKFTTKRLKTIP